MSNISLRVKNANTIRMREPEGFTGKLYAFQKKGVVWMLATKRCALFDSCGVGKTIQALALLQLIKNNNNKAKFLIIVPSASVQQWYGEILKFTNLSVSIASQKTKSQRLQIYASTDYDILLINYELIHRDLPILEALHFDALIADEASYIKNRKTKTAIAIKQLTPHASFVICMSATPIQNNLMDLFSIFEAIEPCVLGSYWKFKDNYVVEEQYPIRVKGGRRLIVRKIVGYQNLDRIKTKLQPYFLRRTLKDVDIELPEVIPYIHWLSLLTPQAVCYEKLRTNTLRLGREGKGKEVRKSMHSLQQSVDGTGSLSKNNEDFSSKLDRIMELLQGDLIGEKAVIFSRYKNTLYHLKARLTKEQIGYAEITGDIRGKQRDKEKTAFWTDPACRVCIGTSALEMSLNLQCARYLIAIDMMFNPARHEQLVGRIRRIGSIFKTIIVINLLTINTFEQKLYDLIVKKQALADFIWDETSDLFDSLSTDQVISLLGD